jgi:hypothetical protein
VCPGRWGSSNRSATPAPAVACASHMDKMSLGTGESRSRHRSSVRRSEPCHSSDGIVFSESSPYS